MSCVDVKIKNKKGGKERRLHKGVNAGRLGIIGNHLRRETGTKEEVRSDHNAELIPVK